MLSWPLVAKLEKLSWPVGHENWVKKVGVSEIEVESESRNKKFHAEECGQANTKQLGKLCFVLNQV